MRRQKSLVRWRERVDFLCRPFELAPVPIPEIRACLIRALAKLEQRVSRRYCCPHVIVHQQKLAQLFIVKRGCRADRMLSKSRGLRRGIRIEGCSFYISATRPKSHADDFVGVCLPCDAVRSGALWRAAPGKTGHGKIEAPPKEMHRADFPDEPRSKFLEDGIDGYKNPPK